MLRLRFGNSLRFLDASRSVRNFHKSPVKLHDDTINPKDIRGSAATKFQVFRNETGIVFDIEEERRQLESNDFEVKTETFPSPYEGLNLKRGINGVFEIEDLVDVLRREKAKNLFVMKFPKDYKYVDYLCICNGISYRHMLGMVHYVRKVFKMKRQTGDIIPKIEGEKSKDWIAMDLGNIALHIFSNDSRKHYDLELLWCCGEDYEKKIKCRDANTEKYQKYINAAAAAVEVENEENQK